MFYYSRAGPAGWRGCARGGDGACDGGGGGGSGGGLFLRF